MNCWRGRPEIPLIRSDKPELFFKPLSQLAYSWSEMDCVVVVKIPRETILIVMLFSEYVVYLAGIYVILNLVGFHFEYVFIKNMVDLRI